MAGQHAFVGQDLVDVHLIESLHVGGQILDLVVGGGGRDGGRLHGLGQTGAAVRDNDAAQSDQELVVHGGGTSGLRCVRRGLLDGCGFALAFVIADADGGRVLSMSGDRPVFIPKTVGRRARPG